MVSTPQHSRRGPEGEDEEKPACAPELPVLGSRDSGEGDVIPDVVLVGAYPSPGAEDSSGVASYTSKLGGALSAEGLGVTVVAPAGPADPPVHWDGAVRVLRPFAPGVWAWLRAGRAALDTGAGVVHLQHEHFLFGGPETVPGLAGALARLAASRVSTVATLHQVVDPAEVDGSFVGLHRMRVPPPVARAGLGSVQRLVSAAVDAAIVHEESFARLVPGAVVVHHGVDAARTVDRDVARTELGVAPDAFVVLCFGFVAPYKGLEIALEAASRAGPGVELVIAGGEHPRLGGYGDELRRRWPGVGRFTGYLSADDVDRWHAAADVALFCYPHPHASSGALATAAGHGTPVLVGEPLARRAGVPAEATVSLDPDTIAARLRHLAGSAAAREPLAAASRALGEERSWGAVARRHREIYEEVIDGRRRSRRTLRSR